MKTDLYVVIKNSSIETKLTLQKPLIIKRVTYLLPPLILGLKGMQVSQLRFYTEDFTVC